MSYVYYSYEEWGRGYIGVRKRDAEGDDSYFGSFRDKTFKPTHKIVLAEFDDYKDALQAEVDLHKFFDVGRNPHFANIARSTSVGFSLMGVKQSDETRQKIGERVLASWCEPEVRERHSEAAKESWTEERRKTASETQRTWWTDERKAVLSEQVSERNRKRKGVEASAQRKEKVTTTTRSHWTRELWSDIENALRVQTHPRNWGSTRIAKKHGVGSKTVHNIRNLVLQGLTFDEATGVSL